MHASLAAPAHSALRTSSGPRLLCRARPPLAQQGWPVAGPHLALVLEPDLDHTHAEARPPLAPPGPAQRRGTGQAWGWAGTGGGRSGGWAGRCRDAQVPAGAWKAAGVGWLGPRPPRPPLTFRQGLEETSKEALSSSLRCEDGPGRGLLGSFLPSPLPLLWLPCPFGRLLFMSPSSSSLFTVGDTVQRVSRLRNPLRAGVLSPPANTW